MDLRTTLSIREELERGLETLLGAVVRQASRPAVPQRVPHGDRSHDASGLTRAQAPWKESRISLTRSTPVWASTSGLR